MNTFRQISRFLLYILCFFGPFLQIAFAQTITINADRNKILIGEQICVQLKLQDINPRTTVVQQWFLFPDTANHIEVISRSVIDSSIVNGKITYTQDVYVTSFDSGKWHLQYQPAIIWDNIAKQHTQFTNNILWIEVLPVSVATMNFYHGFKDIVSVDKPNDIWMMLLLITLPLLVIALLLFYFFTKKKKILSPAVLPNQTKETLQKALAALEELKKNQPVTTEQVQYYYLQIDTICRSFVGKASTIDALHKTSGELTEALKEYFPCNVAEDFYQLFYLCDLVKFGKYKPAPKQCLKDVEMAIKFVGQF